MGQFDQAPKNQETNLENFTDRERIEALDRVISMFKIGSEESAISRAKIVADMEEEKRKLVEKMQK